MLRSIMVLVIGILGASLLYGKGYGSSTDLAALSVPVSDSTVPPPSAAGRLLPANISWMENGLWGESGLVRKIGIAGPLTPETRKGELAVRRTMLTMHQIGGFVTLGLMWATVYYGQRTLDAGDPRDLRNTHASYVTATIISYGVTGLLAILSPPPLIRRDEVSTTTIHKMLAWVHFIGMVVTPIIGASLHNSMSYDQQVRYHQISAYVTAAALTASFVVITF
jgi:hypothetical protein